MTVATVLPPLGAGGFGALVGWYVYYINRYRKGDVQLSDLTTLVGVLGGGTVTVLFSPGGELFGAYGIGLFIGFFGYFVTLIYLVDKSKNFDADWFLDGRRVRPVEPVYIPDEVAQTVRPMAPVQIHATGPLHVSPSAGGIVTSGPSGTTITQFSSAAARRLAPTAAAAAAGAVVEADTSAPTQAVVDGCAQMVIGNAADIATLFQADGGFIPWYNRVLSKTAVFKSRGPISTQSAVADNFDRFWNQIPVVFGTAQITAIEFAALMCIGIRENSGNLWANPEKVGLAGHPGLAYAFDKIPDLKASYNRAVGNWSAYRLFNDADFLAAHGTLPGADAVLQNGVSTAWDGDTWPAGFSTKVDVGVNGFIMQADFYKFRGRGVIQTTGRDGYKVLIDFILNDPAAAANAVLSGIAETWRQATQGLSGDARLDTIATRSTGDEWDTVFGETLILAQGVRLDSDGKGHYLDLSHDATVLNGNTATRGALFFMTRKINSGNYSNEVVPTMRAMINAIAAMPG